MKVIKGLEERKPLWCKHKRKRSDACTIYFQKRLLSAEGDGL